MYLYNFIIISILYIYYIIHIFIIYIIIIYNTIIINGVIHLLLFIYLATPGLVVARGPRCSMGGHLVE